MINLVAARLRRLQAVEMTECGFRVVDGSQPGIGRRWKHGVARVSPGRLEFRPGIGMGIRLARPGQPWLGLDILEVTRAHERAAGLLERLDVSDTARILLVRTATATLEWAVVPEHRDWALSRVKDGAP